MFKLPRLPQSSIKKLPIFNKLLATFNVAGKYFLQEIDEGMYISIYISSFNRCTVLDITTGSVIYGVPGFPIPSIGNAIQGLLLSFVDTYSKSIASL